MGQIASCNRSSGDILLSGADSNMESQSTVFSQAADAAGLVGHWVTSGRRFLDPFYSSDSIDALSGFPADVISGATFVTDRIAYGTACPADHGLFPAGDESKCFYSDKSGDERIKGLTTDDGLFFGTRARRGTYLDLFRPHVAVN